MTNNYTAADIVEELPAGYRWATSDETERWTALAGSMVQVRRGGTDDDPETDLAILA